MTQAVHRSRRRPAAWVPALLAVGALALSAPGCAKEAKTLDPAATERAVQKVIGRRVPAPVDEVLCPGTIPRGKGRTVSCRAVLRGDAGTVRLGVRQTDGEGRLDVVLLDAVLDREDVAVDLHRRLVATYRRTFTVSCGKPGWFVAAPRTTFTCRAEDAAGARTVTVTVADAAGTLRYDVAT